MTEFKGIIEAVAMNLEKRLPKQRATQRRKLSELEGECFYGAAELVGWCQEQGWKYRLRIKGNLCIYQDEGPDKTLDQLKTEGKSALDKARFRFGMITRVGILRA